MNGNAWKPLEYPGTMFARIFGLAAVAAGIQITLDHLLPFLHDYYSTAYADAAFVPDGFPTGFDIYYRELPHVLIAYFFFIVPLSMYMFTIQKSKLIQGVTFVVLSLVLLSWHDYYIVTSYLGLSETIHLFRNAYISLPVMAALHYFIPEPTPLTGQTMTTKRSKTRNDNVERSKT